MKSTTKLTASLLAAAIVTISGCGGNDSTNGGGSSSEAKAAQKNEGASDSFKASDTADAQSETKAGSGSFDLNAYIANYKPKTELTNKGIFDYEVKVNGTVLTCPISTAEIAALGYEAKEAYTVDLEPNKVSELYNDARFYLNKDTGVELVFNIISTTSDEPMVFDSDSPRDDVLFYDLHVNTYETYWDHSKDFEAEFYGGTITNFISDYNSDKAVITSETDVVNKCGKYNYKKGYNRFYYEEPDAEKPGQKSVVVGINDDNNVYSVSFSRYLGMERTGIYSRLKK